jgi:hypothetical protein
MEDRADLVRLAFRLRALREDLEELDRLLDEALASVRAMEAQLRELAGVERIDVQAAVRVVGEMGEETAGGAGAPSTDC